MEITSVNNDLVKEIVKLQQKKYRDKTGKFLLEGRKCVEEAISAGLEIEYVFIDNAAKQLGSYAAKLDNSEISQAQLTDKNPSTVQPFNHSTKTNIALSSNSIIYTVPSVLKKISTTDTPPDVVAVAYKKIFKMPENAQKVVLLENIKDLGNLGTIIRTSTAFGVDAIVLYGESVDIYNPKCVRASVGNLWKVPIFHLTKFDELSEIFEKFERVATLPRSKNLLKTYKPNYPVLVMFGSEADGLSEDLIKFSTASVKIEMSKNVESLNLATSVAVILYKI